jgi:thiol-disulfide isomerase/thioredoxin
MSILRFLFAFLILFLSSTEKSSSQTVPVVKIGEVLSRINQTSDTVLVLNFWATWCVPCIEELPDFIKLEKDLANQPVKFVYLSLDFKKNLTGKLQPFLKKNEITSEVLLLDEPDYNSWIDKISVDWQGAIPATVVIDRKNKSQTFHEGSLNYNELKTIIQKYIP